MDQDTDYHPLLALSISAKPTAAALKISRFDDHWGYHNTTKSNFVPLNIWSPGVIKSCSRSSSTFKWGINKVVMNS